MDSGEHFGFYFEGTVKKNFGNTGDFGNFSRELGNTDPPGGLILSTLLFELIFCSWNLSGDSWQFNKRQRRLHTT